MRWTAASMPGQKGKTFKKSRQSIWWRLQKTCRSPPSERPSHHSEHLINGMHITIFKEHSGEYEGGNAQSYAKLNIRKNCNCRVCRALSVMAGVNLLSRSEPIRGTRVALHIHARETNRAS